MRKSSIPIKDMTDPYSGSGASITQSFGDRNPAYITGAHNGTDIGYQGNPLNIQITSMYPGVVTEANFDVGPGNLNGTRGYGQHVRVRTPIDIYLQYRPELKEQYTKLDVAEVEFMYGHFGELSYEPGGELDGILVKAGDRVGRGTPLGIMGQTGNASGPHTHINKALFDGNGRQISSGLKFTPNFDPTDDIFINPPQMSNALILKDENSDLLVVALPITSPEALKSYGLNFGITIPLHPDGSVNFDALHKDGTFKTK